MTAAYRHIAGAQARLRDAGLDPEQASCDAEVLARSLLGWDRATYLTHGRTEAPSGFVQRYEALLARREQREPVSLITGRREFWGLEFEVTTDVLTPRPETEILVEEALRLAPATLPRLHVVDVGTGSGCLAVAIAHERPLARVTATDISAAAVEVARQNARRLGVEHRIAWVCAPFMGSVLGTPELIVANLPYIAETDFAKLPPEVSEYEPRIALDGGSDGLDAIRQLVKQAGTRLAPGGHILLEFGVGQARMLGRYVERQPGLTLRGMRNDLQGIPRVAIIQRTPRGAPQDSGAS